jgi:DNA modification methylase
MKTLEDNSIDLTVTSPPYDILRDYHGYTFDFEGIAKELFRVTKQGGVVVWVVGDATIKGSETGTSFKQALYFKEIGFNYDAMDKRWWWSYRK